MIQSIISLRDDEEFKAFLVVDLLEWNLKYNHKETLPNTDRQIIIAKQNMQSLNVFAATDASTEAKENMSTEEKKIEVRRSFFLLLFIT